MIDQFIRQLNDADPAIRRRAIVALGKSKDVNALRGLANVVRNDPDPELRDLARKAGQYIRREAEKAAEAHNDTAPFPTTSDLHSSTTPTPAAPPSVAPFITDPTSTPPASTGSRLHLLSDDNTPSKTPPKSTGSRLHLLGDKPSSPPAQSRFQRPPQDDLPLDPGDAPTDVEPEASPQSDMYEPPIDLYGRLATGNRAPEPEPEPELNLGDEPILDPDLFGEPPMPDLMPGIAEPPAAPKAPLIVKGREYNVSRDNKLRAKQYLDAALSQNIEGDNAKAMKSLTEALSLNPNLINDSFFNNVAGTITGLEADEAAQMIIDGEERKRFTDSATQQQKNQRVEKHLSQAERSTWTDVGWELILYCLIVIIGPIFAVLVTSESAKNLLNNFAAVSEDLPAGLQNAQVFAGFSLATLLPIGIVSGISGVISLLIQTVLIHYSSKALGGVGTWRHLVEVLLGFYNHWLPIVFFITYAAIVIAFISVFSPIAICAVLILVILTLYVTIKTASKVGEAYDFGAAKGCMALLISALVIGLINAVISFVMAQALGFAFNQIIG